jgi:L-histidine N-alpha-methyltransferase
LASFRIENHLNGAGFFDSMAEDVRSGLESRPRVLRPKYFYDERGSQLFEQITQLPEYYPTRAEDELLTSIADELMTRVAPAEIVELGSGSSTKTRALLDAGSRNGSLKRYIPFDVSESIVRLAANALLNRYPALRVHGVIGDFERHLDKIPPAEGRRLTLFLGSTIGNLHSEERLELLRAVRNTLQTGDSFLLGVDLVKDIDVIEAAYNDSAGVTSDFNRNMLDVINAGLEANFDLSEFDHYAYFNRDESRIEMHLRPRRPQVVHLGKLGINVEISPEETLWTESSYKFTRKSTTEMLREAGFELDNWYTARDDLFALALASPV